MNASDSRRNAAACEAAPASALEAPFAVEGNELLAAIVESSDDAIISKDLNGIIRSWNRGAERIFGYTAAEVIGRPVSILAVPERAEEYLGILDRIRRGERLDHYETRRRTKDGRVLTVALTVSPIRDSSGRIIGASKVARDITAQKDLAELRQRLAAVVESSDDVIISKDLDGIIQTWNRGAERIFGYIAEEVVGKHISMLAVPERVHEISTILERIRRGERIDHYETQRRTKDGRVLTMSLTVSPIRDASGRIVGASKVARDITDEKRSAEIRERLAAIVDSSDDAIISKDLNGIIQSWNKGAERIFGYTAEEAVGRHISMLAAPERVEEIPDILDRIRRGQRIEHYETRRRAKDGRVLAISLTVSPVRNAAGEIVGASKIARDISERKRLEHELLAQTRALAARERYLQAVLESMPECVQVLGRAGEIIEMNKAGLRMIEADGPEQVGCAYAMVDEPHREAFRQVNETVFDGGPGGELEFSITGLKGGRRTLEARVVPLRNEDNVVIGALSAARDITDRKIAEERLQRSRDALAAANAELRRANADLEQFAYSASHDLKEPLRHVAISSQMLLRKYEGRFDENADGLLRFIVESAKRMDALVSGLLAYTQVANMEQEDVPVVHASGALSQALANLSGAVQESGATIERGDLPSVRVRDVHLVQLFQNLVGNAIKYRGGEAPRIKVSAERDGAMWKFSVKDNGIGIEPQYAVQVFGLFKRLHTSEQYSGTGIGLALCQRIVQRYNGRIWVESDGVGTGSEFLFALPDPRSNG